jgi:molybdate transport system substrate-binding protein
MLIASRWGCAAVVLTMAAGNTAAADAQLAVAANFAAPAKRLAEQFARQRGHQLLLNVGSTGKFYAQIKNGAPFDVFLSADEETPARLEQEKLAVSGTRFAYALGKLVLWSAQPGLVDNSGNVLRQGKFRKLAMANPRLAPYGAAARETMEKLGVWTTLQEKLVQGENIAQTLQFVASGNADLGFVALSQLRDEGARVVGSHWDVPSSFHAPIRQAAVLLVHGQRNPAAREFLDFLRSPPALRLIQNFGYDLP